MKHDLAKLRRLVGAFEPEQLRYIDCFASADLALFMPMGGPCYYALTPEHRHPAYMFVLNFDDQTVVKLDRRTVIARPGRVFALSPEVPHQELGRDEPPRYIVAMLRRSFFERHYLSCAGRKPPVWRGVFFDAGTELPRLFQRFMAEAESGIPGSTAMLDALGIEICHCLIRGLIKAPAVRSAAAERLEVGRAIEHIHSNLGEKLTVETLASIARLSPSHFSRVFRKETGKAPMEYVNERRLERAKKMLRAGDRPVTEIALACGFGSPSYLSACFQRAFRMTPSRFRKLSGSSRLRSDL